MKKFISIILCTLLILPTLIFVGCKKCEHEFVWKVFSEGSCTEKQVEEGLCVKCGEKKVRTGDYGHVYEYETITDSTCTSTGVIDKYCIICGESVQIEKNKKPHDYIFGCCSMCGRLEEAEELTTEQLQKITIKNTIMLMYSIDYFTNKSISELYIDSDDYLNITFKRDNKDIIKKHRVERIEYQTTQINNNIITSALVNEQDEVIFNYSEGGRKEIKNISNIKGFFVDTNRGLFIVNNDNQVIKVGNLRLEILEDDTQEFVFTKISGGYKLDKVNLEKKQIEVPSTYEGEPVIYISINAFSDNKYVESVVIGDYVEEIEDWAFANCTNLKAITFGSSVKIIHSGVFHNVGLETINYKGTKNQKSQILIGPFFNELSNVTWNYI